MRHFINSMCIFLKKNNLHMPMGSYSSQVFELRTLINLLKSKSLIFISFQHIDLDAW
jgi:hypothetical protein